jgi:hypothetical protein
MDMRKPYSLEDRSLRTGYWKCLAWLGVAISGAGVLWRSASDMKTDEPIVVPAQVTASGNKLPDIGGWFRSVGDYVLDQANRSVVLAATVGVLATAGLVVAARRSHAKEARRARFYEAPAWEWENNYTLDGQVDDVRENQEHSLDGSTAAQVETMPEPLVDDPWAEGLDRFRSWKDQSYKPLQRLPQPMSEGQKRQQGTLYPSFSALEAAFETYRERQLADANA